MSRDTPWVVGSVKLITNPGMSWNANYNLKTKLLGPARASALARNESSGALRRIQRRREAVLRTGRTSCLHDPSWVKRVRSTPPRVESRALPLVSGVEGLGIECTKAEGAAGGQQRARDDALSHSLQQELRGGLS